MKIHGLFRIIGDFYPAIPAFPNNIMVYRVSPVVIIIIYTSR